MTDDEISSWENYESGPFCPHWSDPSSCDEVCTCGHPCHWHSLGACMADGCQCSEFEDTQKGATS